MTDTEHSTTSGSNEEEKATGIHTYLGYFFQFEIKSNIGFMLI